jgi:hypothetical protein
VKYLDGDFRVVRPGAFVRCAVTGEGSKPFIGSLRRPAPRPGWARARGGKGARRAGPRPPQGVRPQYRDLPQLDRAHLTKLAMLARSMGVQEVVMV